MRLLATAAALIVGVVGLDAGALAAEPRLHIDESPRFVSLQPGDEGPSVELLQRKLSEAKLYQGEIDGVYGDATAAAVVAMHKLTGGDRSATLKPHDWVAIEKLPRPRIPMRGRMEPDRVEVDIGNQLIYLIQDHQVTAIVPTSTGGSYVYWSERQQANVAAGTPRGDFEFFRFDPGWRCDPVTGWCVYNYWAFTTYYGLHGYLSVPAYPASHGCVRLHTWNSDWLSEQFYIGMPIHIWDEPPSPRINIAEGGAFASMD